MYSQYHWCPKTFKFNKEKELKVSVIYNNLIAGNPRKIKINLGKNLQKISKKFQWSIFCAKWDIKQIKILAKTNKLIITSTNKTKSLYIETSQLMIFIWLQILKEIYCGKKAKFCYFFLLTLNCKTRSYFMLFGRVNICFRIVLITM